MAFTVTKDTVIGDVLDYDRSLAEIFFPVSYTHLTLPTT